jgi:hypothetical protein
LVSELALCFGKREKKACLDVSEVFETWLGDGVSWFEREHEKGNPFPSFRIVKALPPLRGFIRACMKDFLASVMV